MKRRDTRDCEATLDGRPVASTSQLHQVASFLDDLRLEAAARPAPAARPALAAIFDGRRPVRSTATPVVLRPRTTPRVRPVAAVVAAATVTFGGLASAGALPGPVQRASAQLGTHLGIRLPGAPQPPPTPITAPETPRATPTTSPTVASTTTAPQSATTTTTIVPNAARTIPTVPVPTRPSALPELPELPVPGLRGPIGPTGLELPIHLPRPTFPRGSRD